MNRAALVFIAAAVVINSTGCCLLDRIFCGSCRPFLGCNRFHGCAEPPSNCGGCCPDNGCSTGGCARGGGVFGKSGCNSCGLGSRVFSGGCRTCGGGFGGHPFAAGCRSCGGGHGHGLAGRGGPGGPGANPYGGGYASMPRDGYNVGNPYGTAAGGPPTAQVAYPYYTTRGPRDFLVNNPGYPSN